MNGLFKYSSQQLRIWNEVATIFLVAIVMLVVVKQNMSVVWGIGGLVLFVLLLLSAIRLYKTLREKKITPLFKDFNKTIFFAVCNCCLYI